MNVTESHRVFFMPLKILAAFLSCCFLFVATSAFAQQNSTPDPVQQTKPFMSELHTNAKVICEGCHGKGKKAPVEEDKCLECHESFKSISERTKDMKPNPHFNHLVKTNSIECTDCHHGHKADEILCLKCHQEFKFDRHK